MASVTVTPMPSSVCRNRQLDQPRVRISPFVPLRSSFVLTIMSHLSATSFAGKVMSNGADAAARIQSSIAGRIKLRNTLPPLASNDLLCAPLSAAITIHKKDTNMVDVPIHDIVFLVVSLVRLGSSPC